MKKFKIVILLMTISITMGVSSNLWASNELPKEDANVHQYSKEYKDFLDLNNKGLLNSMVNLLGGVLSVAEDVAYTLLTPVQALIKQNIRAIYENPYRNLKAYVRLGDPVCEPELLFREKRFPEVKKAQEKMLDMHLEPEDVLEIGISCSGGGWRAMCCSLGSCVGSKKIGLLDCSMYISALSGSTWFVAPWLYSGMDLYDYRERAIEVASDGLDIESFKEAPEMLNNIWVKLAYNQPLSPIDLYASLLSNSLFRGLAKDPHRTYMTDQRQNIASGKLPMPIYTATLGEIDKKEFWFEFTPYESGSRWLGAYVPTWAFGRHFKNGESKDHAPEQCLGFLMGIFGSAFAADFEDIYDAIIDDLEFPNFLKKIPFAESIFKVIKKVFKTLSHTSDLGDIRVIWSRVPNFVYGMKDLPHNSYKELKLVDAGLDFNNPVFSLYRKPLCGDAPDIIFVFDSGATLGFKDLDLMGEYARYHGLKFPKIERFEVGKQILSVFKDDNDIEVPVIVYMPRINGINLIQKSNYKKWYDYYLELLDGFDIEKAISSGFANTFNFDYTKRQAEILMTMTEFNIVAVSDKIKEIMKDRIEAKRKFKNIK